MTRRLLESRRRFLQSTAAIAGGALLSGCLRRIPTALWAPNPDSPLTIDVHCHFFNGSDLQVESFLRAYIHETGKFAQFAKFIPLLQSFEWVEAPTAKQEMKKLRSLGLAPPQAQEKRANLRKTRRQNEEAASSKKKHPALEGGGLELGEEYLQYRYVTLGDYLTIYSKFEKSAEAEPGIRTIDLAIAHLVDYDWPLNNGTPTRTPLADQVELMQKISVFSKGRVHTFAPFDPFREIAHQAGVRGADWSPLDALKNKWVAESGCIGVKLYPTMGFAPYGNSQVDPDYWCGRWEWLPDVASVPDSAGKRAPLGRRLDAVLAELYEWCVSMELPVMAHTDLTNGPTDEFNHLAEAKYWQTLRSKFGGLRVNFGHLGGLEDTCADDWRISSSPPAPSVNARDLVALMSSQSNAPGSNFYADSAFNETILTDPRGLLDIYRAALLWKAPGQTRAMLPDRLMYGTDWSLLMQMEHMEQYFKEFIALYARLDDERQRDSKGVVGSSLLSERFFGSNAVNYLGLMRGGQNRERLTKFYACKNCDFDGRSQPVWMDKITT